MEEKPNFINAKARTGKMIVMTSTCWRLISKSGQNFSHKIFFFNANLVNIRIQTCCGYKFNVIQLTDTATRMELSLNKSSPAWLGWIRTIEKGCPIYKLKTTLRNCLTVRSTDTKD